MSSFCSNGFQRSLVAFVTTTEREEMSEMTIMFSFGFDFFTCIEV